MRRCAVGALAPPFLQQIFSDLVARQFALLVLDATDLRILQELGIEFDQFKRERVDRTPAAYPRHPGERVADTRLQRGRQPATPPTTIEKPWLAIAGVAGATGAAAGAALIQPGFDLLAAVGELGGPHDLPTHVVD